MRTFIIGAGASKAYDLSPTNCTMPIANDFFKTFEKLDISTDLRVLIGDIINIGKNDFGIDFYSFFSSSFDIEDFHTYIEKKLIKQMQEDIIYKNIHYYKAYLQLIFLYTSIINEIQNGPISKAHIQLIKSLRKDDSIITFNWDTLLDRALSEHTHWAADFGYCLTPEKIYRDKWVSPEIKKEDFNKLIKLHGSTNWLTTYPQPDKDNLLKLNQKIDNSCFYIYEHTNSPYHCYDGRFEGPYEPFSYFYYPPNILDDIELDTNKDKVMFKAGVLNQPESQKLYEEMFGIKLNIPKRVNLEQGIVTMPLIIPPVKDKKYTLFANLFIELWDVAKQEIINASEIFIIGYSFPKTDTRTIKLFEEAFCEKKDFPKIIIVNPEPDNIIELFKMKFGIPMDNLTIYKEYFNADFDFDKFNT
ncbi:MAG: hypothetical protein IBX44_03550 [Sulfurospirillum sp.]|nr:hypothetical protein [Sulfurospirillum sp.]